MNRSGFLCLAACLSVSHLCRPVPCAAQPLVEIEVRHTASLDDDFVSWAPTRGRIRLKEAASADLPVVLTNDAPGTGGDLWFANGTITAGSAAPVPKQDTLPLTLSKDASWREFLLAGKFNFASVERGDARIQVHQGDEAGPVVGEHSVTVRVRKNALRLSADERTRLLQAIRAIREAGTYRTYQDIHRANPMNGNPDAHFGPAFLAWHRVLLLRYERDLQAIDPSVSLPYWQFDRPANIPGGAQLFAANYMGSNTVLSAGNPASLPPGQVTFAASNPLFGWTTDLLPGAPPAGAGLLQRARFDRNQTPTSDGIPLPSDASVVGPTSFESFRAMEGSPHGSAHVWGGGGGSLGNIPTAVEDPLFFLLHCNVDRLWAQWQRLGGTTNPRYGSGATAYSPQSPRTFPTSGATIHIGHYIEDTMWPWNQVMGSQPNPSGLGQRPNTAPGGPFPVLSGFAPSTNAPRPIDTLDYLGRLNPEANMGYSYDDDPFAVP